MFQVWLPTPLILNVNYSFYHEPNIIEPPAYKSISHLLIKNYSYISHMFWENSVFFSNIKTDKSYYNFKFKNLFLKYVKIIILIFCVMFLMISGVPRGGGGVQIPPSPKFRRPSKIVPNSTWLWKLLKKNLNLWRQHTKMFGKKTVNF